MAPDNSMLTGSCHCGAVRIELAELPQSLIDCNCSICRRNAALWAIYESGSVRVSGDPGNTTEYIWGARTIKTLRCSTCGCVTHWLPLQPESDKRLGVNMRNFNLAELAGVRIRRFDGAETWSYLDEP